MIDSRSRAAQNFRSQLRRTGLQVESVSWVQGGYEEIAAIVYRDPSEIDRILEILSPVAGIDISRVTPTRVFIKA